MPDAVSTNSLPLPAEAADKLISSRDGTAALIYLYLLRGGSPEAQAVIQALHLDSVSFSAARARLEELDLWPRRRTADVSAPEARDISHLLRTDEDFAGLCAFCEQRYGKALSRADLERLNFLHQELGLPADVLAILITHCFGEYAARCGEGRLPRLSYIEKVAVEWMELGLVTPQLAEEHLARREQRRTALARAARVVGISGRALTRTEEKYLSDWLELGFSPEALERAYDITVVNTGQLTWRYMDSILRRWHQRGSMTPEQIDAAEAERRAPRAAPSAPAAAGSHEQQAVAWTRRYARTKQTNGGEQP